MSKFLLTKLYQYSENMTKNSLPQGQIRSLKFSIALELGLKQTKQYKGKHLK